MCVLCSRYALLYLCIIRQIASTCLSKMTWRASRQPAQTRAAEQSGRALPSSPANAQKEPRDRTGNPVAEKATAHFHFTRAPRAVVTYSVLCSKLRDCLFVFCAGAMVSPTTYCVHKTAKESEQRCTRKGGLVKMNSSTVYCIVGHTVPCGCLHAFHPHIDALLRSEPTQLDLSVQTHLHRSTTIIQ